jgi:hypothetical protein
MLAPLADGDECAPAAMTLPLPDKRPLQPRTREESS